MRMGCRAVFHVGCEGRLGAVVYRGAYVCKSQREPTENIHTSNHTQRLLRLLEVGCLRRTDLYSYAYVMKISLALVQTNGTPAFWLSSISARLEVV